MCQEQARKGLTAALPQATEMHMALYEMINEVK